MALRFLGGPDLSASRLLTAVAVGHGLGTAILFVWAWRRAPQHRIQRALLAGATATLGWLALARATEGPTLWNPSFTPLPVAIFVVALAYRARRASTVASAVAGAALGFASSLHLSSLLVLPVGVIVARGSSRRPYSLPAFLFAFAAAFAWESEDGVSHLFNHAKAFVDRTPLMSGAGILAWVAAGFGYYRVTRRWPRLRVIATLVGLAAPLLALPAITPEFMTSRYYAVSLVALPALFAEVISVFRYQVSARGTAAWIASAALWSLVLADPVASSLSRASRPSLCRGTDIETLAVHLDRMGIGYDTLARGARGPGSGLLALHLAAVRPLERLAHPGSTDHVFLACVPRAVAMSAPSNYVRVALGPDRVGLLRRYEGRVTTSRFELCLPGLECAPGEVDPNAIVSEQGAAALASRLPIDIAHTLSAHYGAVRRGEPLRFRLSITAGPPIVVRLAPGSRVESVEGLESVITRGDRLTVSGREPGTIVTAAGFDWARFGYSPPDFAEEAIENAEWLAALPWSDE